MVRRPSMFHAGMDTIRYEGWEKSCSENQMPIGTMVRRFYSNLASYICVYVMYVQVQQSF